MSDDIERKVERLVAHAEKRSGAKLNLPWVMHQTWENLLFMHWPIDFDHLRSLVPPELEIDTFEGQAYVTMIPMHMNNIHLHDLPAVPGTREFPEINLRTYVRMNDEPGIFFFTIDSGSSFASWVARHTFFLPYIYSKMSFREESDGFHLESKRPNSHHAKKAEFSGSYHPVGEEYQTREGTLEHFLVERYAMYDKGPGGDFFKGNVQHPPWRIQKAEANIEINTVPEAAGIDLGDAVPMLLFAYNTEVLCWPMVPVQV